MRMDRLAIDELVLLDPDPVRSSPCGGLARRMLVASGWKGKLSCSPPIVRAALDGADFVLIQLRVGGQAARYVDETLPHQFGIIGQETTGPGGFAKALRTVPLVLEIAEETARRGDPGAWIVDFTNPVGIVTQALLNSGARALGLCNVAIGLQRHFAARFGVAPERVRARARRPQPPDPGAGCPRGRRRPAAGDAGRRRRRNADERLPAGARRGPARDPVLLPALLLRDGRGPGEQRDGPTRAEEVIEIERELLEMYRDPTLDTKPELLEHRGGAFYSEAAAQLIASLHAGAGDIQVVNVRNGGALPGPAGRRGRRDPGPHRPRRRSAAPDWRRWRRDARPRPARQAYEELTIGAALIRRRGHGACGRCWPTRWCAATSPEA